MSYRFYCEELSPSEGAKLEGPEAHHLAHVMRVAVGDAVVLFDGKGHECAATVRRIGKARVELDVTQVEAIDRELSFSLVLGVALPKGERQKWLVEKAVELGVTRLVPLKTQRGVADPGSALTRLRRGVIEASKQCGRNRLMEIDEVAAADAFFGEAPAEAVRLIGQPSDSTMPAAVALAEHGDPRAARFLAVGPEGGFTEVELSAARAAGWQPISLGPRVLRVETAAVALAALAAAVRP